MLAVQSWRWVRNGLLRRGHSLAPMRPVPITVVAAVTLGSVAAVGHELGSASRLPEVGSSIDGSSAAVLRYPATQPPGGVTTTAALGIWVPAMTDDPAWVGHSNWTPDWGFRSDEAD